MSPHVAATPLKRKIAAILAADVAGYSRLVAADEEGTLRALADARSIFDARVSEGGGRIFNTAGDSVMCEFDSAVEAVRAAIDIQDRLGAASAGVPAARRLAFRIGITIGDVVERGGDLLGDGVNIASRLEALAPPGGVCVSRSVHEAVANKVAVAFEDLGPRPVKNIPQPIHAFLIPAPVSAQPGLAPGAGAASNGRGGRTRLRGLRPLLFVALGLSIFGVRYGLHSSDKAARQETPAAQPNEVAATSPPPVIMPAEPRAPAPDPGRTAAAPAPKPLRATARGGDPAADAAAFAALARDGVPVAAPKTVVEFYFNARQFEAKGDKAGALRAYAAAAPAAGEAVDFHVRHAGLLRGANGAAASRRTLAELARTAPSRSLTLGTAAGPDDPERRARLEEFAGSGDFTPADFVLAEALLSERGPGPTLTDRRLAFEALDRFLDAAAAGTLARFYIDRTFLDGWIDAARRRRGEIETYFATAAARPGASFARTATGWTGRLSLPEPATAVSVRIGERGDFVSTGFSRALDARTARPAPETQFDIPAASGRTTIYVAYTDRSGRQAGPFPLTFDPAAAAVESGREVLERFPDTWVAFRPDLPDLLSFAGLVSNRCAIGRALIGYGNAVPRDPLPLPACDGSGSASMPSGTSSVVRLPAGTEAVQVQLTYADGSESQVRTFRRP